MHLYTLHYPGIPCPQYPDLDVSLLHQKCYDPLLSLKWFAVTHKTRILLQTMLHLFVTKVLARFDMGQNI